MKGLKFRIGATIILLLGAGMILINIVLTMFWQRDMVRARIDQLSMAMAISTEFINPEKVDIEKVMRRTIFHTGAKCALFRSANKQIIVPIGNCEYQDQLRALAEQAIATGNLQTSQGEPGARFLSIANRLILVAKPFVGMNADSSALALAVSLQPLSSRLISNQKAVFLYIFINMLILTAVGLVRMVKVVIRPIERLARISETYTDEEGFHFMATTGDDEFRRLSTSINQMLKRIEADKNKLKTTVRSLQAANKQLKNTQKEMVRSEKLAAVGRLAAGLAHEIGNPVGIIQGYLDLIGQEDILAKEKKDYLTRADKELQRIGGLIRNLLDFSRPDRQSPRQVSVHQLLTESVDMIKIRSKKEAVVVEEQYKAEDETVFADPDQLRQVFLNCLLNAFDAVVGISQAPRRIAIITELSNLEQDNKTSRQIRIRIEDSGPGISEIDLPKVFDPFFTTKEPGKGTGLGLFVSHTIVENLGGRMAIDAKTNTGTAVIIEIPLLEN